MMSSVRSKNTKIEIEIRQRLFHRGFRYKLHGKNLPGTPDLVFPKYSAVIFVNGCFWHYHGCRGTNIPDTRYAWWKNKLEENRKHDKVVIKELNNLNWRVLIIWECSFRKPKKQRLIAMDSIVSRADNFLKSSTRFLEIPKSPIGNIN